MKVSNYNSNYIQKTIRETLMNNILKKEYNKGKHVTNDASYYDFYQSLHFYWNFLKLKVWFWGFTKAAGKTGYF